MRFASAIPRLPARGHARRRAAPAANSASTAPTSTNPPRRHRRWPRSYERQIAKESIAAATDFLAKRRVHDVDAAARIDWTRAFKPRDKRGRMTRSVEAKHRRGQSRARRIKLQASIRGNPQISAREM